MVWTDPWPALLEPVQNQQLCPRYKNSSLWEDLLPLSYFISGFGFCFVLFCFLKMILKYVRFHSFRMIHVFHFHSNRTERVWSTLHLNSNLTSAEINHTGVRALPSYIFCDLVGCEAVASPIGILTLNMWRGSINSPTTCSQIFYQGHFRSTGKAAMVQWKLSLLEAAGNKTTGS